MTTRHVKHLHHHAKRNPILAALAAISTAALLVLIFTNGATIIAQARSIFLELESGNRTNVTQKTSSNASGGKYIQFNNATDTTPAPTPTPEPEPEPTPTPTPPPSGFPNASTTGLSDPNAVNQTLSGKIVLNAGDTLENTIVNEAYILVKGGNVTIRNVKLNLSLGTSWGIKIDCDGCGGILIEDIEVNADAKGLNDIGATGVGGDGQFTLRNAHLHGLRTGIRPYKSAVIEGNYIHNSWHDEADSHGTAMSIHGASDIVIRNNNFTWDAPRGGSSGLSLYGNVAPLDNILIEGNLFDANAAYCFKGGYSTAKPYGTQVTNIVARNNFFGRTHNPDCGRAGPVSNWNENQPGNSWCNNAWLDTGELIRPDWNCLD